jgi:hypothetical protein
MKRLLTLLVFVTFKAKAQVFWNHDTTDNNLVNQYGAELQYYRVKYKNPKIAGFIKSINLVNGSLMENVIVNYVDKDGEQMQDLVSSRIISFKEVAKVDSSDKFVKDSIAITSVKEIMSDSISFEATGVRKFNAGYLVIGNIKDGGVKIPIAVSNFNLKDTIKRSPLPDYKRFSRYGSTVFNKGKAVGSLFQPINGDTTCLLKLFEGTPDNWTGQITDNCYVTKYEIPLTWWNADRHRMSFEEQLIFINKYF